MSDAKKYMQNTSNSYSKYMQLTYIFIVLLFLFFIPSLEANGSGSSRYRDRFAKVPPSSERENPAEEEEEKNKGTKGGKTRKKKKKDDDIVIPFGLEKKAPSKVFLEVEHGEIIASSYTGFTKLEPAWEPIAWSPIADSWDRDSLGTSVQTALIEGNGFTVVENGILWSPDGHHSSVPEIGQDLGLGETGVLLLGFAGQLSIYNSAHTILSSAKILTPGAIAAATGRALSAATRLAPRAAHRATPAAIISAPGFIILDTVTRPRGPYCPVCVPAHHYRMPHTNIVPNRDALPGEIGYDTGKPDAVEPDGRTWPFHALGIYLAPGLYKWYGWVGTEKGIRVPSPGESDEEKEADEFIDTIIDLGKPGSTIEDFINEKLREDPFINFEDLVKLLMERFNFSYEIAKRFLQRYYFLKQKKKDGGEGTTGAEGNSSFFPPILLPMIPEEERERMNEFLGANSKSPSFGDFLNRRGKQNAMRHHISSIY